MSLANGQCAHRQVGAGRCLELAITTRPFPRHIGTVDVIYDVPLCHDHGLFFDSELARV